MGCCKCDKYGWGDSGRHVQSSDTKYYCILHAPTESKSKFENTKFMEVLTERLQTSILDKHVCDLRGVVFDKQIKLADISAGEELPYIDFSDSTFEEYADFKNIKFKRGVKFTDVSFNCVADFRLTEFYNSADFSFSVFNKRVSFSDAIFHCKSSFNYVSFSTGVIFTKVLFKSKVQMIESTFSGITSFTDVRFINGIKLYSSSFNGVTRFDSAKFYGACEFSNTTFISFVSLLNINVTSLLSMLNISIEKTMYISFSKLEGKLILTSFQADDNAVVLCDIKSDKMNQIHFSLQTVRAILFLRCEFPEKLYVENEQDPALRVTAQPLYRALKQKASGNHDQAMVSKWHYREKLMALEQLSKSTGWKPWKSITWWYYRCSGFGEDPKQASKFLAVLFGCAFLILCGFKLSETSWSPQPDWNKILEIPAETLALIPLVKFTGGADSNSASLLFSIKRFCVGLMQIALSVQTALFAFALRNRFRR